MPPVPVNRDACHFGTNGQYYVKVIGLADEGGFLLHGLLYFPEAVTYHGDRTSIEIILLAYTLNDADGGVNYAKLAGVRLLVLSYDWGFHRFHWYVVEVNITLQ